MSRTASEGTYVEELPTADAEKPAPTRGPPVAVCEHIEACPDPEPEASSDGCPECLANGQKWVHLRKCLICGHVGCCDSSEGRHATAHFNETGHAAMRSAEPGEDWTWCYVHRAMG